MKKSVAITLALVFALGVTGAALANPFSDVPANHWAYASIGKLAEAGIIEGYGDGRYAGGANITRYEAAQIIAKALARADKADAGQKAQIDRLAAEFSQELQSLGVRVGRLEKKTDNVTVTGEIRFAYYGYGGDYKRSGEVADFSRLRTHLYISGQVSDGWQYTGLIEHDGMDFQTNSNGLVDGSDPNGSFGLRQAWVDGKIGLVNVTSGTFNYYAGYGALLDNDVTGLNLNYQSDKLSADLFAIRPESANGNYADDRVRVLGTQLGYTFNDKLHALLVWYNVNGRTDRNLNNDVFEAGLDYSITDAFKLWGQYIRAGEYSGSPMKQSGWALGLNYDQKDLSQPGSFEAHAGYYKVPPLAAFTPTHELSEPLAYGAGYKGFNIGASYVLAKNIDLNVEYYAFGYMDKSLIGVDPNAKANLLWTHVTFYF